MRDCQGTLRCGILGCPCESPINIAAPFCCASKLLPWKHLGTHGFEGHLKWHKHLNPKPRSHCQQVLSALLGAGFKEEFQRRVRIQSYDQKVGHTSESACDISLGCSDGMPPQRICKALGPPAHARPVNCSGRLAQRMGQALPLACCSRLYKKW